jgi:FhaA, N-terminal domain/FHA domain
MGVAKKVEQRLEGLVEGFFARVFRSGLQPVEVGRRIIREMNENKTVSVNRVYVPNEFHVEMGAEDYQRFAQMEEGLRKEFSEIVIQAAKENRWNLMGMPEISFEENPGMRKGQFKVEPSLNSGSTDRGGVSTREPDARDPDATRAVSFDTADRLRLARTGAELIVLDQRGEPSERIAITREPVVIGRMSSNDVVLADSNVSRRHAELRRDPEGWLLVDLGSTNGTLVNGKLAREHRLTDGDRLTFGTSELVFKGGDR